MRSPARTAGRESAEAGGIGKWLGAAESTVTRPENSAPALPGRHRPLFREGLHEPWVTGAYHPPCEAIKARGPALQEAASATLRSIAAVPSQ